MNDKHSRRGKVCIFIDNNTFSEILDGRKINIRALKDWLQSDREAVVLRFYCGETNRNETMHRTDFYDCLRRAGFEIVVQKNPQSRYSKPELDPAISHGIACAIAWDMCELLQTGYYDSFILVTGAFELSSVVPRIRKRGVEVEVAFTESHCSPALRGKATMFRQMDLEQLENRRRTREKVLT